ncbi:MAG: sensor histidine kinase [Saprospiraceae bacterium]
MNIFQYIFNLGVEQNQDDVQQSTIRALNKIALLTIPIISCYSVYYIFSGQVRIFLLSHLVYVLTGLTILFLHANKKLYVARWATFIGYNISFLGTITVLGSLNDISYFLLLAGVGSALLFEDRKSRIFLFSLSLLFLFIVAIFTSYYPNGLLEVKFPPMFSFVNATVIFTLIYIILETTLNLRGKFQNALINKNKDFSRLNASLEQIVEERTAELQAKSHALERTNKELKRFSYISSHDLKEPLRNIMGFAQLLERDIKKKKYNNLEEYAEYINWGVNRLASIIQDIENYTEIEELSSEEKLIDLDEVLLQVVQTSAIIEETENAVIEIEALPSINMNEKLAELLFHNIIANGLIYSAAYYPTIKISCQTIDSYYLFKIEDNGLGISVENQEIIFEMFKRLGNDKSETGSGIGLAICKKIVELKNGRIWVESEVGKGSTFYFTLKN